MKRFMTILLAGLTAASLLASCGGSSSSSSSSSEAASDSSAAEASAEASSEGESTEVTGRLAEIKSKGVIVLATSPDFAPNEFEDISSGESKYVGCDIDLAQYIADYLGVDLEIQAMDFQACQAAVATGKADFSISGYAYSEERAENYEIPDLYNQQRSDEPGQVVLVHAGDESTYNSPEAFEGKTIGAQNGSLQYTLTEEQLPGATIKLVSTLGDGVLMVQNQKIDGLACSGDQARLYAEKNSDLAIADWYFDYTRQGNIILCKKGETSLVAEINKALAEVNDQDLYSGWKAEATELARSLGIKVDE